MLRSRRGFAVELLSLGAAAVGCSAGVRDLSIGDSGTGLGTDTGLGCPPGTTGFLEGQVLEPVALEGYVQSRGEYGPMSLCDYWDPDGNKGIHALLVIRSGAWCVPCQELATVMRTAAPPYLQRGARILEVLVQGRTDKLPATQTTVENWINTYLCPYDVARADLAALKTSENVPMCFFVNPRTMVIDSVHMGSNIFDGEVCDGLEAVLVANGR